MKKITLQFKAILQLVEFIEITHQHKCAIDTTKLTIVCELSEAEIELAKNAYEAVVVEQ